MNILPVLKKSLSAVVLLAAAISCSDASFIVRTPLQSTGVTLEGLGVELDPHFISQNVTRDDGATLDDWQNIVVRRVKMMAIQRIRVMLLPHWWEPVNDNSDSQIADPKGFTFESAEMKSVYDRYRPGFQNPIPYREAAD